MRPPPNTKIPHTQSVAGDSTAPEDEWDDTSEDPDQIGRVEKRRMYLHGLRNLLPELMHAPVSEAQASGFFSMLHVSDKVDKMPFLAEMFQQISISEVNQSKKTKAKKRQFVSQLQKWYPTTEPAEGGLLQPRSVPKELSQCVSPQQIS